MDKHKENEYRLENKGYIKYGKELIEELRIRAAISRTIRTIDDVLEKQATQ